MPRNAKKAQALGIFLLPWGLRQDPNRRVRSGARSHTLMAGALCGSPVSFAPLKHHSWALCVSITVCGCRACSLGTSPPHHSVGALHGLGWWSLLSLPCFTPPFWWGSKTLDTFQCFPGQGGHLSQWRYPYLPRLLWEEVLTARVWLPSLPFSDVFRLRPLVSQPPGAGDGKVHCRPCSKTV